jgi:DNA-binding CsgD family transcriptional regulator
MWTTEQWGVALPMRTRGREVVLSERERQIVALVGKGYTNQQIAHALELNTQTVKNKLTLIYDKTGTRGRVQLAVYAMDHEIE